MKLVGVLLVALTMTSMVPAAFGVAAEKEEAVEATEVLDAACPTSAAPAALTSGTSVTGTLPATFGAACYFTMVTDGTSDAVKAKLTGLPADFDLYVRMIATPTTSLYDCRPYTGSTTSEHCTVLATTSKAFVMVRRFSGSGDFTLTVSNHNIPVLNDGPAQVEVPAGSMEMFKLNVAAGNSMATLALAGDACRKVDAATPAGTADPCRELVTAGALAPLTDADLYVRVGALPTTLTTGSSCRVVTVGIPSVCVYSDAAVGLGPTPDPSVQTRAFAGAGTYFVGVRGTTGVATGVVAGATA